MLRLKSPKSAAHTFEHEKSTWPIRPPSPAGSLDSLSGNTNDCFFEDNASFPKKNTKRNSRVRKGSPPCIVQKFPGNPPSQRSSSAPPHPLRRASDVGSLNLDDIVIKVRTPLRSYVLSRYVLSRLLAATKVDASDAVAISLEVKRSLVRSACHLTTGSLEVPQGKVERVISALLTSWGYGPQELNRYRVLSQWRQQRRPLLILMSGTTGLGMSMLAAPLAERLNLSSVVRTDVVAQLMHMMIDDNLPVLHDKLISQLESSSSNSKSSYLRTFFKNSLKIICQDNTSGSSEVSRRPKSTVQDVVKKTSSCKNDSGRSMILYNNEKKKLLEQYFAEREHVLRGVSVDLEKCFKEGRSMLLVGPHISPQLMDRVANLQRNAPQSLVVSLLVTIQDPKVHQQWACRAIDRDDEFHVQQGITQFNQARVLQDLLLKEHRPSQHIVAQNANDPTITLDFMHSFVLESMENALPLAPPQPQPEIPKMRKILVEKVTRVSCSPEPARLVKCCSRNRRSTTEPLSSNRLHAPELISQQKVHTFTLLPQSSNLRLQEFSG